MSEKKQISTTRFWNIIFPILCLLLLLFVVFVIFAMPDWALTCEPGRLAMRKFAASISTATNS
jgi:hypothetical protein